MATDAEEMVDVELWRFTPDQYANVITEDGHSLVELFPERMYVVRYKDTVLEVAPVITDRMREMGFTD
jgi:hypothetical protein